MPTDLLALPLVRLRLEARAETPVQLPDYAGSTLRGAFGHALRKLACMTRQKECAGCALIRSCPYAQVFETAPPADGHALQDFSDVPRPYVIEPPAWGMRQWAPGESLDFHLVLIGRAVGQIPLILLAWQRALARGIGAGDGRASLQRVLQTDAGEGERLVFSTAGEPTLEVDTSPKSTPSPLAGACRLRFHTPLRLQKNGHALAADSITTYALLMALARRLSLLAEFHGPGAPGLDFSRLATRARDIGGEKRFIWRDWTRRSARQQRTMTLGGLVGDWHLDGDLAPFTELLHLGQWTHVGKEAVFGLGGYHLACAKDISAAPREDRERPAQIVEFQEESEVGE